MQLIVNQLIFAAIYFRGFVFKSKFAAIYFRGLQNCSVHSRTHHCVIGAIFSLGRENRQALEPYRC